MGRTGETAMKKCIVALLATALLVCLSICFALADDSCGPNLTWALSDTGVLTISGTGEMSDCRYGSAPWKGEKIKKVVIEEGVTSIGDSAFYWCRELESVQLPESLVTISDNAFENCSNLVTINIPSGLQSIGKWAFYGCENLAALDLNEGLQTIGELAFCDCKKITKLIIPSSVVSISDDRTFKGCAKLTSIEVAEGNPNYCSVDGVLFSKDMTVLLCYPAGKADTSYVVPDSVTKINSYAFYWNENIISITIPETVTMIGGDAFAGCKKVTELTIPEGVQSIGSTAFHQCNSLTTISFPASLVTLGEDMFESCYKLMKINVAEGSSTFKSVDGVLYSKDGSLLLYFPGGQGVTTYTIPQGVKTIGKYAFLYNKTLVSVTFPEGLETISTSAFKGCKNLVTVNFPKSLTTLDNGAFGSCDYLTSITLPEGVLVLGDGVFSWCKNLVSVTVMNPSTSFNKYGVFKYGNDDLTLYGLAGSTTESHAKENSFKFVATTFDDTASATDGDSWICPECGTEMNGGKFCYECGTPRPEGQVCKNCGYKVEEGKTMKFCPECGTPFEE